MRAAILFPVALATPALAEVKSVIDVGFEVVHSESVAAAPAVVWPVITKPSRWWSSAHTFSGDASNLSIDARPGGCFAKR